MASAIPEIDYIARRSLTIGGRNFAQGDRVVPSKLSHVPDRALQTLVRMERIVPLTRQSYQAAMRNQPLGHVGRGFTIAELLERKIIDRDPEEDVAAREAEEALQPGDPPPGTVEYRGAWLVPVQQGAVRKWEVWNTRSERILESRLSNEKKAQEYVDKLRAGAE